MNDLFPDRSRHPVPPARDRRYLDRVYFALKPGPDAAGHVLEIADRLRSRHGLMGRVSPAALHVTLCPIGTLPGLSDERIATAGKVAAGLLAEPLEILFDRVRTYPSGRAKLPLVIFAGQGQPRADLFRQLLIAGLRRSGFLFRGRQPALHMTLFYDRSVVPEEPIDPIAWTVRDFVLVHSIHGESRHVLLGRWPLRAIAPDAGAQSATCLVSA